MRSPDGCHARQSSVCQTIFLGVPVRDRILLTEISVPLLLFLALLQRASSSCDARTDDVSLSATQCSQTFILSSFQIYDNVRIIATAKCLCVVYL